MWEILFIFGMLGLLLGHLWEYLSSLPAFPTIQVAAFAIPLAAIADYMEVTHRLNLGVVHSRREPVPPERFYWALHRSRLLRFLVGCGALGIVSWNIALNWPASDELTANSATGWISGTAAVFCSARFVAYSVIYVRASQWFDKMTPWFIGACRRAMYRMSENPDFLGSENPPRREREKSVY